MSTKSRDETDTWIVALQSILSCQTPEVPGAEDEDEENVYDDPLEVQQQKQMEKSRVGGIQGRHLPSVPPAVQPSAGESGGGGSKATTMTKPINNNSANKLATIFKFPGTRGRSTSSEEEPTPPQRPARQSVDSSTDTDDLYQELPSPGRSNTPYSSVESVAGQEDEDCIYNDVHTGPLKVCPFPSGKDHRRKSIPNGSINKPPNLPAVPAEVIETLPVYDIPSPTIRPLSVHSEGEVISFARKMSESRARLLNSQLQAEPMTIAETSSEVYDVPAPNPKRISDPHQQQNYDRVPTPPRSIAPPPPAAPPENSALPPMQKMARFWQDKLGESAVGAFKKEPSPPKCLPQPASEVKSVGRSFSRSTAQRAPLTGLADLMSSSGGNALKPSALKAKEKAEAITKIQSSIAPPPPGFNQGAKSFNLVKKDTPPRPPPPARPAQLKIPSSKENPPNLAAELNQQLAKRQQNLSKRNGDETSDKDVSPSPPASSDGEEYRTRFPYVAQNALELSFNSGESVQVLSKSGPSWLVRARSKKGLVPRDYLEPINNGGPTAVLSI